MIYRNKPAEFKPSFEVASCIIEYDTKILCLKRLHLKSQGGKWGLPTGKVNENESLSEGVIRETFEETGIKIINKNLKYIQAFYVNHGYDFIYHLYHYNLPSILPIKLSEGEHEEYRWVSYNDLFELDLVEDLGECVRRYSLSK